MKNAVMEVDLKAFKENLKYIQNYVGEDIILMPVIKANGYGTHINTKLEAFEDYKIVAVARSSEASFIRNLGYKGDILILNQPDINDIEDIIKQNVTSGICEISYLQKLVELKQEVKVHLELETGMGRTGVKYEDIESYCHLIKENPFIKLEGVYTHFSVADSDESYTKSQIDRFNKGLEVVEKYFKDIKYIHTSASNGILNFENNKCNTVRPGIIMYGYESFEGVYEKLNLKPVAKLKSKINFVKTIQKGDSVSYGRIFIADRETKVATVPLRLR